MTDDHNSHLMLEVHDHARAAFGGLAEPLCHDEEVQLVALPCAQYKTIILMANAEMISVRQQVAVVDSAHPGLAACLLRESARWVLARPELLGDVLTIEHCFPTWDLSERTLSRTVVAVHMTACETEQLLAAAGVTQVPSRVEQDGFEI